MRRIIIFDSPDGTGKTNIAKELSRQIDVPYFKFNREHDYWRKGQFKTALEFDQPYLLQLLQQTNMSLIIDRAWPAEEVYSQVFGRETNLELIDDLDMGYSVLGAIVVVPLRSDYDENRKDELVPPEKLAELHRGYEEFCAETRCSTIRMFVDDFGDDVRVQVPLLVDAIGYIEGLPPFTRANLIIEGNT